MSTLTCFPADRRATAYAGFVELTSAVRLNEPGIAAIRAKDTPTSLRQGDGRALCRCGLGC